MKPQPDRVLDLFQETGAYLNGHFRLSSGLHSPNYLQSALVLRHPAYAEQLGQMLGDLLFQMLSEGPGIAKNGNIADFVISPALGGLIVGHEVARALGLPFLFAERDAERKMALRRGFTIHAGERAIVIEDVITTGGSTREVIEIVHGFGAQAVAAGSIIDRSGGSAELGIPRVALETLTVESWTPELCPLCKAGKAVTKPGSRPV